MVGIIKKKSFFLFCSNQMLMDPMGGIVMTNDGNAILREVRNSLIFCALKSLNLYLLVVKTGSLILCIGLCFPRDLQLAVEVTYIYSKTPFIHH